MNFFRLVLYLNLYLYLFFVFVQCVGRSHIGAMWSRVVHFFEVLCSRWAVGQPLSEIAQLAISDLDTHNNATPYYDWQARPPTVKDFLSSSEWDTFLFLTDTWQVAVLENSTHWSSLEKEKTWWLEFLNLKWATTAQKSITFWIAAFRAAFRKNWPKLGFFLNQF